MAKKKWPLDMDPYSQPWMYDPLHAQKEGSKVSHLNPPPVPPVGPASWPNGIQPAGGMNWQTKHDGRHGRGLLYNIYGPKDVRHRTGQEFLLPGRKKGDQKGRPFYRIAMDSGEWYGVVDPTLAGNNHPPAGQFGVMEDGIPNAGAMAGFGGVPEGGAGPNGGVPAAGFGGGHGANIQNPENLGAGFGAGLGAFGGNLGQDFAAQPAGGAVAGEGALGMGGQFGAPPPQPAGVGFGDDFGVPNGNAGGNDEDNQDDHDWQNNDFHNVPEGFGGGGDGLTQNAPTVISNAGGGLQLQAGELGWDIESATGNQIRGHEGQSIYSGGGDRRSRATSRASSRAPSTIRAPSASRAGSVTSHRTVSTVSRRPIA